MTQTQGMTGEVLTGAHPVHVMHVSQPTEGGTATVVEQLAQGDLAYGRTVTIASPPGRLQQWASEHAVRWIRLPLTRQPKITDLMAIKALRRLLPGATVVYLHSSKAGAVGRMALATLPASRRPKCVFVPHAWSWYVGGRFQSAYRRFERLASYWADAIVVLSSTEARDGRKVLPPAAASKFALIHNGVDLRACSISGPRADRVTDPLVVCVGRLCKQKGQDLLIRAVSLLPNRSVRLRLVGDGPDESRLRQLAGQLGLSDRVEFIGSSDPRPHYRTADVVVLPSRWEGQSLVLLEAMACGAAVLASPAAASGLGRSAGILSSTGHDPEHLVASLAFLLSDSVLRDELAQLARRVATEQHSIGRTARDHHDLITLLTARSEDSRPGPAMPSFPALNVRTLASASTTHKTRSR